MDILVKISVPSYIYRFYHQAAQHIAEGTPEQIMSDTLSAYAGMLSKDIAKQRENEVENDSTSTGAP